jgi:hypothetical protein
MHFSKTTTLATHFLNVSPKGFHTDPEFSKLYLSDSSSRFEQEPVSELELSLELEPQLQFWSDCVFGPPLGLALGLGSVKLAVRDGVVSRVPFCLSKGSVGQTRFTFTSSNFG